MVTILMMSAKMVTLGLFKIKVLLNKGYNVIICVYNVTYKVLLCDSIYVVYVVMQPKFGNSSTSMREVIKTTFFARWSCFNFNNLGRTLVIPLKFYASVVKRLKPKFKKFLGLIPTFVEVTGEKLILGGIPPLPPS